MKARTVVGMGGEGPLCDPGSELLLGERAISRSARIIRCGMKNKKNIYENTWEDVCCA